jgi:CBS domain-containing protein
MTKTATEIMNRNFYFACPSDSVSSVLESMAARGLSRAPVLDLMGRPLGTATAREIEHCHDVGEVASHLRRTTISVPQHTDVETAARVLSESSADELVLTDDHGVAVGALSAMDLLRAVLGTHAAALDVTPPPSGVWSEAAFLSTDGVHRAPAAPGLLLISHTDDADVRSAVWVESSENVQERLDEMLRMPQSDLRLERLLTPYPRTLRFRVLVMHDRERRERLAAAIAHLIAKQRTEVV